MARAETVESAIDTIAKTDVVHLIGWKSLFPTGRPIITRVFEKIRECFIADLTSLNPNVLFELGYAIAHRKRIGILLDTAIEKAKLDFNRLQLFTTIGYEAWSNSESMVKSFFRDQSYRDWNAALASIRESELSRADREALARLSNKAKIRRLSENDEIALKNRENPTESRG
jgi:hypothetical protein